ncbi:MAG TPA: multicopper oxidase domain-containing protein, partial [Saprospiraceae bacterium]|nr:multicopper oxidase domain-containing protein [Saprospiraceae bacterium]
MRKLLMYMLLLIITAVQGQKVVRYDLMVTDTIVNYTGKERLAIAVNGKLPAPTLYFTEGDTAEIHVRNMMHHETSVHWHGILLPNEHDGVPYLTSSPIEMHETHVYRFAIKQSGTYWYHSHSMLQEQIGLYG